MNGGKLTFFIEGIGSAVNRNRTAAGWILAAIRAGKQRLTVTIEGNVPQKDCLRPVTDRTGVTVIWVNGQRPGL